MKFCFVHAADLHLDTPFQGISTVSPEVAGKLRDASLDAFDALIEFTIKKEAAFLLLAGDIYDGSERGVRAQLRFKEGLEKLSSTKIQIPVFIVHGNHDPLGGWSAIKEWPRGVKIFGPEEVNAFEVKKGNTTLATIYGISYGKREVTENLALRFQGKDFQEKRKPGLQVGLLHCTVDGNTGHAPYSPCSKQDLLNAKMDYWALGHIHKRRELDEAPRIEYPGNLQGRSPRPGECEPKGALLVEVNGSSIENVVFEPLDRVRFLECEIDIPGIKDLDELKKEMMKKADQLRKSNKDRGLVIRSIFKGRGKLHRDLRYPGAIEDILGDLREKFEEEQPFIWWESIRDKTRPGLDPAKIRSRKDFSAELINLVEAFQKKEDLKRMGDRQEEDLYLQQDFKDFIETHLEKPVDKARLSYRVPELDDKDIPGIVEEAMYLALDLLEG